MKVKPIPGCSSVVRATNDLDLLPGKAFGLDRRVVEREAAGHVLRRELGNAVLLLARRVDRVAQVGGVDARRVEAATGAVFRHVHEAVIGGEHRQHVVGADRVVDGLEQLRERSVEADQVILRLDALGSEVVVDVVVAGEAHAQDVGGAGRIPAQLLVLQQLDRELGRGLVAVGSGEQRAVIERAGRRLAQAVHVAHPRSHLAIAGRPRLAVGERALVGPGVQHRVPALVEPLVLRVPGVVALPPSRVLLHVIAGAGEAPRLRRVHVRGAGLAGEQDRAAVLAGDAEHAARVVGRVAELVAQRADLQVLRADAVVLPGRRAVEVPVRGVRGVVDVLAFAGAPLVADDARLVRVRTREHRGVTDGGDGERVRLVRVGKPRALVHQPPEAVLAQQVVVLGQLLLRQAVDHQHDHQLRRRDAAGNGRVVARHGRARGEHEQDPEGTQDRANHGVRLHRERAAACCRHR